MEIICSKNAIITFESIVDVIENDFGNTAAKKNIDKTISDIKNLALFPFLFKKSE